MSDQTLPRSTARGQAIVPAQAGPPSVEAVHETGAEQSEAEKLSLSARNKRDRLPLFSGFAAGVLALGLVWAAVAGLFGSNTFTLSGRMTLVQSSSSYSYSSSYSSSAFYLGNDGTCYGTGGYSDIRAGTAVNVYNAAGDVVAVGQLSGGTGDYSGCTLSFSVPDVPGGSNFYQVEVSHRGKMNLTDADARAGTAAFSLGG